MYNNLSGYQEVHTVTEFIVTATAGNVSISSSGSEGILNLNSQSISLNANNAILSLCQGPEGGGITLETNGEESSILLNTLCPGITGLLTVTPKGILLVYGPPGATGAIQMGEGTLSLTMGEPEIGSSIEMTPESITFKIGPTSFTMTAEGLVTKCAETAIEVSAEGITESVGEVSREMTAEGHNLTAAETEVNVGVQGTTIEGVTNTMEFEAASEFSGAMISESAEGVLSVETPLTNIE